MTDPALEEFLERVQDALADTPASQRRTILAEMRTHLELKTEQLVADNPGMPTEDAVAQAIEEFGSPEEIVVEYGGGTSAVRSRATGDVLLELLPRAGIALSKAIKIGAAVGGLFLVGLVVLLAIYQEGPFQREYQSPPIYSKEVHSVGFTPRNGTSTEGFDVPEYRSRLTMTIEISQSLNGGCAVVTVRDPDGQAVFDNRDACGSTTTQFQIQKSGRWTVEYEFIRFTGSLDVRVELA